ncbi:CP12 domain-containing protein 1 [Actinidia rufa]|uniref:CP12 domain-containing protein 1 n=1 Tax=Actinidia rufa TaxID=165716 RepID=A0A7J0FIZ4_9ERIC|nr:CP12 domain-containing protein 1 [Actinidia rufa]
MATISGVSSLSTPRTLAKAIIDSPRPQTMKSPWLNHPWKRSNFQFGTGRMRIGPVGSAPEGLSEKVVESIKNAEDACAGDPVSGECVAAWDEVEELSAAASHARDKKKDSDPLETYCADNPETDECRTYDN